MKTTTFNDILNAAAEFAMRTRDQIPGQEYVSLQGFLAAEFLELRNQRAWPDLIPAILNVQAANNQFSKNEGLADELGDILGIYHSNPETCVHRRIRPVGWSEGDNVVYVETNATSLWVEYELPYPSVNYPDLATMTNADFLAAKCLLRFRNILAHKAAGHILNSDTPNSGAGQFVLAEKSLVNEINRLPPEPWWRGRIRLRRPQRRGHVWR